MRINLLEIDAKNTIHKYTDFLLYHSYDNYNKYFPSQKYHLME